MNAHSAGAAEKQFLIPPIPSKGWAEMILKVYEVDPLLCPKCGAEMRIIAFLTDYSVVDRIIKLTSDHAAIYDP